MEYPSLKVPELRKILQERSLPTTGNKADLVARLQEDDKSKAPAAAAAAQPAEDEIDYSDDEVTITTKAAEAKSAPAAEPAAAAEPAPAAENADSAEPVKEAPEGAAPANGAEETSEASKFALNLPATATEDEVRKRAERAKRFGVVEDNSDAAKKAERAKRFGGEPADVTKGLDSALPERPLKRRGQNEEGGGRKRQDRRDNRRGGRGRQGRTGGGRNGGGVSKPAKRILDDPSEKAKAEARAKRFGAS